MWLQIEKEKGISGEMLTQHEFQTMYIFVSIRRTGRHGFGVSMVSSPTVPFIRSPIEVSSESIRVVIEDTTSIYSVSNAFLLQQ